VCSVYLRDLFAMECRPEMATSEELLRSVPLFAGLSHQFLAGIARLAREQSFQAGETIVRQGNPGHGLYVIVAGQVDVVREVDGDEVQLRTMGPGEVFGELALLTHSSRHATVRATKPTDCLAIASVTFERILDHSPEVGKALATTLARWLEDAERRSGFV